MKPELSELRKWLQTLLKKQNRARLALVLGCIAMALILLSELFPEKAPAAPQAVSPEEGTYKTQLEQQLTELIEQVQGAGKTTVMLTLESGEETVYALDTLSGQTQTQQTHVLLDDGTALEQTVYLPTIPRLCGAAPYPKLICICDLYLQGGTNMRATAKSTTRKATAITLAAALVVAVYLNWQYSRTGVSLNEDAVNVSAAVVETEAEAVAASPITDGLMTEAEAVSSANKNYGEAQLVSVANDSGSKFFEEARLKREKAHDAALDTIQKTLKSSNLSAEEKKSYARQLTGNLEDLNAENEIETLVKAKGFADCLCFLQSGRADLTVMTSGDALTAAQVAQIRDIVLSKSSVTAQNITVVEVK